MAIKNKKAIRRMRVKRGIRKKISGSTTVPRLTVFRSNDHIYAQLVDDIKGATLASSSTLVLGKDAKGTPIERAKLVGQQLATNAREHGIEHAVFDRNGYKYHGRVQAVADGAREGGLKV